MSARHIFLVTIFVIGLFIAIWRTGMVNAQEPAGAPQPTATPALVSTGSGWVEATRLLPAQITAQALNPVDCNTMTSPVVGFEISKGQDSNDITDLANDLVANGFSLGTVNLGAGPIPACVDVLIVQGLAQNLALIAPYTAAEAAQVQTWVAAGHGLLLSGDWGPFASGTAALFQAYGYALQGPNPVTDPTDADLPAPPPADSWVIYQTDNFAAHPALSGVSSIEMLTGAWLSSPANAIITTDADATPAGAPIMAALANGSGCAVLATDSNWNSVVGTANGYFKQNNARAARQLVQWLSSCSKLVLTKTGAPNPVQAGQILTYTLTVTNYVDPLVSGVIITDVTPANTSFVGATAPHQGPDLNGVITWTLGTLNLNASAVVTLAVQVNGGLANGAVISNTAWIASSQGLTGTAVALVNVSTPPQQATITGLVWQDSNGNALFESASELPLPNITVIITDSLGLAQYLTTDTGGYYTATVAAGTVTVDVDEFDPNLPAASTLTTANDPATITVTTSTTTSVDFGFQQPLTPQLHLDLQVSPTGTVNPNNVLLYTLAFSNSGLITATNVVITDLIPVNSTFVSGTLTADIGTGEFYDGLNWVAGQPATVMGVHLLIPALPPDGATHYLEFSVQVNQSPNSNQITNQAALDSNETLPQTDTEVSPITQVVNVPPAPEEPKNNTPPGDDDDDSDPPVSANSPPVTTIPPTAPQATSSPLPVSFLPDTGIARPEVERGFSDLAYVGLVLIGAICLGGWGIALIWNRSRRLK